MEHSTIPLNALRTDARNVRRNPADQEAHDELVASIRNHGLLENLVVTDAGDGTYGVAAGGRRFAALTQLAEEGHYQPDQPIQCLVIDDADAAELSLVENTIRTAMHPADQVVAFHGLQQQGATPEDIGNRFGLPANEVKGRLRLGGMAKPILDDWRDGELHEEAVYAFASTTDAELQERLYKQLKKATRGDVGAWQVKRELDQRRASVDGNLTRFVTLKAYEKAGGRIEQGLFDDAPAHLMDPDLLTKLAVAKLEKAEARLAKEGWKWTRSMFTFGWQERDSYAAEMDLEPDALTPEEEGEIKEVEAIFDELRQTSLRDATEDQRRAFHKRRGEAVDRQQAVRRAALKRAKWSAAQLSVGGAVVCIGHNGRAEITRGLVDPSDAAAYRKAFGIKGGSSAKAKPKGPYANPVIQDLRMIRGAVARRALAEDPRTARDVIAFFLARKGRFLSGYGGADLLCLNVADDRGRGSDKLKADECGEAVLSPHRGKAKWDWIGKGVAHRWDTGEDEDGAPMDPDDMQAKSFAAFMTLTPAQRDKVLAHAVADLLVPRLCDESDVFEHMARLLEIDWPKQSLELLGSWPATAFWSRLSKPQIMEVVEAELGAEQAELFAKMKKGELVEAVDDAMMGRPAWTPKGINYPLEAE